VSLVNSLLSAISRADGDALVLHVGERPYIVSASGQSELSSRVLTFEAMLGMLRELLPDEARGSLDELGAVQHELPNVPATEGERFAVVAARGGDDIWIEIRRHRKAPEAAPPPVPQSPDAPHGVVLPLARNQVRDQARVEHTLRFTQALHTAGIDRLLRIAAARGASTLYLTSQARPSIRVDGEISPIDGEPVLSEPDVEALMLDLMPERNRETLRTQAGTEWICDVPDVGRIRCVTFRDHRGAGGIFRMIPARAISAEQLGLSREIQGLCAEADGLVLVTGPRSSGKSTLISAFVDLINRTRSDHVITLEHQIKFVHEIRGSLVSQREVRGDNSEWMTVARAALRENPDVLVIEDFRSPDIVTLAVEAAQSGHLVIGALTAHTATEAIDRIIDQMPPDRRAKIQLGLAEALRGVVAQVLLRKSGGGRVAAREVLLNTAAVANLIAEGKTSQLPMALDSGRRHGMVALNDALVAFVQSGIVDSREAYRHSADQAGFLALLKRQGIDTSFVERLA
jgi:twitching motility protein PilT